MSFFEKRDLIQAYHNNDTEKLNSYIEKYPEYKYIKEFDNIAKEVFEYYKNGERYFTFDCEYDFFNLVDSTFRGESDDVLYITHEDEYIFLYPNLMYDRSCMLYIEIPNDFSDNPEKYRQEFIDNCILSIAKNYLTVKYEDENGLTGELIQP